MRELDTESPVVWPAWCYTGEVSGENVSAGSGPRGGDRGEATDLGTHAENNDGATLAANTAVDARGGSPQGAHLSGAATPRPPRSRRRQNQNGLNTTQVKTERLTPDNNSTSSRSVTPSSSSHPGTPPNATPLGGPEGPPPPYHLKHMEQMMEQNCSDFMRRLAAKYNNANPNDKDPKEQKQDSLFGNPVFPPMLDMSSTQALLHMVRTANAAQNAAELETYLKGANKRDAGVTSPLDLSTPGGFAPRKRQKAETRRPGSVSPKPKPTPRPTTPPPVRCPSLCGHMPCGDGQAVNRWTIEDVVNYVSSIDSCAEYAQNFREHRIDGAALPLLSEDHLTGPMGMKLGPALKLRALLARKLGACTVCLHCAHCHQTPLPALNAAAAAAAVSQQQHQQQQQQQQQMPGRRPSSTGN
ncbi:polycomb protein Scm-like isoform X2 [Colletes gigas]|uniref:polycomb protein Scm-like isoform X2 n=1 Tax=Colletes gigas TaxID=935657 RepID=UPI001C9B2C5C|nr:polycomb protein Scm-like isoform X2 [Colletes gigas]